MSAIQQAVRAATNWSSYQEAIFSWGETGTGNAIVIAVAGSGKSTTGVELVKRMRGSHIYLAFNKAIATELAGRGVNGRTFHSLCFTPVTRFKNVRSVEANKLRKLVDDNFAPAVVRQYGQFITKMVGLARNAGIGAGLAPNVPSEWEALASHHDLEPDGEHTTVEEGIQLAQELLALSDASEMVDFDDLLYIAVKEGISLPKFDNVLVDEAQDTNAIQRALVRKIMHPRSRLVAVGDPAQAIYGFRGADSDSMELIKQEFSCTELPLTVTYRCPTSVVKYAQQWVDHIEAAPGAVDGEVSSVPDWTARSFSAGDLVVCRTTKPIISLAYNLIRNRVAAHVMGREIGQGLKALVNKMNAKGVDALVAKLQAYSEREAQKHIARGDDAKAEAVRDKVECVLVIAEGLAETNRTVPALLFAIDELFNDANGGVKLATIHKAKGLEANRVWWLNRNKCPAQWARQPWQLQQEDNLCYVAATRAKSELFLIEERERT